MPHPSNGQIGRMPSAKVPDSDDIYFWDEIRRFISERDKNFTDTLDRFARTEKVRDEGYKKCVIVLEEAAENSRVARENSEKALDVGEKAYELSQKTALDVERIESHQTGRDKKIDALVLAVGTLNENLKSYFDVKDAASGALKVGGWAVSATKISLSALAIYHLAMGHVGDWILAAISLFQQK